MLGLVHRVLLLRAEVAVMVDIALHEPRVAMSVTLSLTEEEAAALAALFGYSLEIFIDTFYRQMGKAYLQPHEAGLRSLADGVIKTVPPLLHRARKAREAFKA